MDDRTRDVSADRLASRAELATDLYASPFRALDHAKESLVARATAGLSPAALMLALADWCIHLAVAPGKQMELVSLGMRNGGRIAGYVRQAAAGLDTAPLAEPAPGDRRFADPAWQGEPHRFLQQSFLLAEQWWNAATREVPGMTRHHADVVSFGVRQWLDMFAPTNYPYSNPQIAQRAGATLGASIVQGALNMLDDVGRRASGQPPAGLAEFGVGRNLAVTPGKVVFRNHLIELIQYSPTTAKVLAEPVLIVPAWIMKYYILDLSPHNSLIRYLVDQGHTVFCISWRNVGAEDRDISLDDYRQLGVMAALDTISTITPQRRVHATGYCLGGTLMSIAAAAMAGVGDDRLASVSLFAAQTDFSEPGELQLFIDDSEVYFLESLMWSQGYLSADQMSGAFQLLQSNDLVWSRLVHDYLLGERAPMSDLMAWNADATRMPYRMHSEYLRKLFLDNDLACGRYEVDRRPISIRNIRAPMFVVGTERDHIAPWHSVFKIFGLADTAITFVLTSGGHNAGIVSEPGHPKRHFRLKQTAADDLRTSPEAWLAESTPQDGSWWPAWTDWLAARSSPRRVAPPAMGGAAGDEPLVDAPGTYVLQA